MIRRARKKNVEIFVYVCMQYLLRDWIWHIRDGDIDYLIAISIALFWNVIFMCDFVITAIF